jgi:hypothetical protein
MAPGNGDKRCPVNRISIVLSIMHCCILEMFRRGGHGCNPAITVRGGLGPRDLCVKGCPLGGRTLVATPGKTT